MPLKPGSTYDYTFSTSEATTALFTAVVKCNGATQGSVTPTRSSDGTNKIHTCGFLVPADWAAGDAVRVEYSVTTATGTYALVDNFTLESITLSDVPTVAEIQEGLATPDDLQVTVPAPEVTVNPTLTDDQATQLEEAHARVMALGSTPIDSNGSGAPADDLVLVKAGDDYTGARPVKSWTIPKARLGIATAAEIATVQLVTDALTAPAAAVVMSETSTAVVVNVPLTRVQTSAMKPGTRSFDLQFVLTNGEHVTPISGSVETLKDYAP